jgi:hypothetical protein
MFPAHLGNERSDNVITDFAQTFERETGLPMTSCREIVEDSHSIFHSFSYLIEHLFYLIDSAMPCQTFIIKGLTVSQRRDFYVELSEIGIHFTKNRYLDDNHNQCTDICISTANIWSVPDYRTTPELAIYQHRINVFNEFYSRIDNLVTTRTAANGNIIVSLENFLKFKRIFADALSSYNHNRYINYNNINNNYIINNIVYMPNQPPVATTASQRPHSQPCVSSNTKIKHQLADLIFDIKDDLTDCMYKEILEKIALISP